MEHPQAIFRHPGQQHTEMRLSPCFLYEWLCSRLWERFCALQIDEGYLSEPTSIEFPTEDGLTAFMNYYPPANKDFKLPPGQRPPLLVKIHGGPTAQASTTFSPLYQYWTSRGVPSWPDGSSPLFTAMLLPTDARALCLATLTLASAYRLCHQRRQLRWEHWVWKGVQVRRAVRGRLSAGVQ